MKGKNGKSEVASGEQKQRGQCRNHTGEREADGPPKDRVAFDSKSSFSLAPPPVSQFWSSLLDFECMAALFHHQAILICRATLQLHHLTSGDKQPHRCCTIRDFYSSTTTSPMALPPPRLSLTT
ncbi:hypothetical protein WN944_024985 [Citrus x changshan-huyou]|uniref:Uncharacterized protein n=1 Tax=Citrus x changshan-huyou TaxID=2935761 RepID=A0AAP0LV89_9ROSI